MSRQCPQCAAGVDALIDAVGIWIVYPCGCWLSPDLAIEIPWTEAEIRHRVRVAQRRGR